MNKDVTIIKSDGEEELFDRGKLEYSLRKAGAKDDDIKEVTDYVVMQLTEGMTTSEIYKKAFSVLKKKELGIASRYSLRRALLELGPTGFLFENFIAELFKSEGYTTSTGSIVKGKCAEHELDLVASKGGKCLGAELKFHNKPGVKTDLKVALYVHARFLDLIERKKESGEKCEITKGLLITNTKFTLNAVEYGVCAGLTMIGWNYPPSDNLQDLIEQAGIHPITSLTTLSMSQKRILMEDKIMLCKMIPDNIDKLSALGLSEDKINNVLTEVANLCRTQKISVE